MEHSVPAVDPHVVMVYLSQYLCREDKAEYNDLEYRRYHDLHLILYDGGNKEENQGQDTEHGTLIVPCDYTSYKGKDHQYP